MRHDSESIGKALKNSLKSHFWLPEVCLWLPSRANTLLPEPWHWEGRLIALAPQVVPSAANPVQLTNRLWLHPGAAVLGHLSPLPCGLLPQDLEEHKQGKSSPSQNQQFHTWRSLTQLN